MAEPLKTLPPDVAAALSRGNVIEAIKLLRSKYNVGLAEARALLEALQKQSAHAQIHGQAPAKSPAKAAPHIPAGMKPGHHHPHTAATLHIDPNMSPGEVPRTSGGMLFAAVVLAVLFVLGVAFYL
jgi:hypothetical protein